MRKLVIIPIVHSASDLGRLQGELADLKKRMMSPSEIESGRDAVEQFWIELKHAIKQWSQDFSKVQIYQDALPVGPDPKLNIEQRIVDDLAAKGSENHKLLKWMIQSGAKLVGTEDPALLMKEYELVQKTLHFYSGGKQVPQADFDLHCENQKTLLRERDAFIASRIDDTLLDDHLGIIFLGLLHRLESYLSDDIHASFPFGKPNAQPVRSA
jgi:hypothetical protein